MSGSSSPSVTLSGASFPGDVVGVGLIAFFLDIPEYTDFTHKTRKFGDGTIWQSAEMFDQLRIDVHGKPVSLAYLAASGPKKVATELCFEFSDLCLLAAVMQKAGLRFDHSGVGALKGDHEQAVRERFRLFRLIIEETRPDPPEEKVWAKAVFVRMRQEMRSGLIQRTIAETRHFGLIADVPWVENLARILKKDPSREIRQEAEKQVHGYLQSRDARESGYARRVLELLGLWKVLDETSPEITHEDLVRSGKSHSRPVPEPPARPSPPLPVEVLNPKNSPSTKSGASKTVGATELSPIVKLNHSAQEVGPVAADTVETDSPETKKTQLKVAAVEVELPIDQVEPSRFQPRDEIDWDHVQEVADSIEEVGQLSAIIVRPTGLTGENDKRYLIVCGENRYWATKDRLKRLTIRGIVDRSQRSDEEVRDRATADNACRQNYAPMELAREVRRMLGNRIAQGLGRTEAAKKVGRILGTYWQRVLDLDSLNNLVSEFQKLLGRKVSTRERLPLTAAFKLADLSIAGQRHVLGKLQALPGEQKMSVILKLVGEARDLGQIDNWRHGSKVMKLETRKPSSLFDMVELRCGDRMLRDAEFLDRLTANDIIRAAEGGKSEALPSTWLANVDKVILKLQVFREILRQVATGDFPDASPQDGNGVKPVPKIKVTI